VIDGLLDDPVTAVRLAAATDSLAWQSVRDVTALEEIEQEDNIYAADAKWTLRFVSQREAGPGLVRPAQVHEDERTRAGASGHGRGVQVRRRGGQRVAVRRWVLPGSHVVPPRGWGDAR